MNNVELKSRNTSKLEECEPKFREKVKRILSYLESIEYRPRIQEAYRSKERQLEYYKKGVSKTKFGYHNSINEKETPASYAVDILDDDEPLNPSRMFVYALTYAGVNNLCTSGAFFGLDARQKHILNTFVFSHFNKSRKDILLSLHSNKELYKIQVGWDPLHIQEGEIKIRNGKFIETDFIL